MVQFFQLSDRITLYQGLWNYVWSFTLPCPMKCEQKWCVVQWAAFERECFSQVALVVKNLLANAGDIRDSGLIPGLGRTPEGEHGNSLHFSCLENSMDGGAWQATVHSVTKSQTQLSDYHSLKLATICCHSPRSICLLHRPNRKAECGWDGNHYPFIF